MITKNKNKKPEYYKYLEFLSQHSKYNMLDIHIKLKGHVIYQKKELQEMLKFKEFFSHEIDIVDLLVLDGDPKK
jgi:hypothetical protein